MKSRHFSVNVFIKDSVWHQIKSRCWIRFDSSSKFWNESRMLSNNIFHLNNLLKLNVKLWQKQIIAYQTSGDLNTRLTIIQVKEVRLYFSFVDNSECKAMPGVSNLFIMDISQKWRTSYQFFVKAWRDPTGCKHLKDAYLDLDRICCS